MSENTPLPQEEEEVPERAPLASESVGASSGRPFMPLHILIGALLAALLGAFLMVFVVEPQIKKMQAQDSIVHLEDQRGPLQARPNNLALFPGEVLEGTNPEQKALADASGQVVTPPAFTFTNEKESEGKKQVEVYLDFSSQRSRDFLLMNASSLQGMIEGGLIDLIIHPVVTSHPFSLHAAEGVAESFYSNEAKAWPYLLELMRASAALAGDESQDFAKVTAEVARKLEVASVDEASIRNGTFTTWLLTGTQVERLQGEVFLPLVFVEGKPLEASNLNDPQVLRNEVMKS